MELKDTVELMLSDDYRDRFKAEYWQTVIRHDRLVNMLMKIEDGTLGFKPLSSINLLKDQRAAMLQYIYDLEVRAESEGIKLR